MDPGFFCRTSGLSNSTTWEAERGGEGAGAQLSLVLRDLKLALNQLVAPAWAPSSQWPQGCPLTFPLLMTRMRSQLRMVVMRCAIISTVQPRMPSRVVRWIRVSVSKSVEAVASSIRMM